jgi:quercetin dioxygenase-like cupin family protein
MFRLAFVAVILPLILVPPAATGQEHTYDPGPEDHVLYSPNDARWSPGPASFSAGARYEVLEGDPGQPGMFTMRILMPDGFVISPHTHPGVERVTILAGTFRLGMGDQPDRALTRALPAGSYFSLPPGEVHYAYTEGETIIQLSSLGPWEIDYMDPEDDPRRN